MNRRTVLIGLVIAVFILFFGAILLAPNRPVEVCPPKDNGGGSLLVLLHGYQRGPENLKGVEETVLAYPALTNATVLKPKLPMETFSVAKSEAVVAQLLAAVDKAWDARPATNHYTNIVFIGHSAGALYARKLYVAACGEQAEAPFEPQLTEELARLNAKSIKTRREWADSVHRIVLLAGMNRGWSISSHMRPDRLVWMSAGMVVGHILQIAYQRPPFIFSVRRGSSFITDLRLQWLAMSETNRTNKPITVQLLGTVDDLVSPDDNLDLVTGKDFVYKEVPLSGHSDVVEMGSSFKSAAGTNRANALLDAIQPIPSKVGQPNPAGEEGFVEDKNVTDVVFVIHGIRDEGYWTRKIAFHAQEFAASVGRSNVATVTSTYGYFPMLAFLHPEARQEKVEWLMDRYTEAKARYPNAKRFHYLGHSNGTYLLAKALEEYPAVHFDQVVFAGSVVRCDYPWGTYTNRIKHVLNIVASADWVVAWFPKTFETLPVKLEDLGGAGHDGFLKVNGTNLVEPHDTNGLPAYVAGHHSAGLDESLWDTFGKFLITGQFDGLPSGVATLPRHPFWVNGPSKIAPLVFVVIGGALVYGFVRILKLNMREWKKTLCLVAYCYVVWIILTRV